MQYKGIVAVIVFALLTSGLMMESHGEEQGEQSVLFGWEINNGLLNFIAFCNGNNYTWDFGDGSIGYGKVVSHEYASGGEYDVKLIVDGIEVDERTINTNDSPPEADFYWLPSTPYSYEEVMFIDNSTDDGFIVNWSWDIENDGIIDGYGKYIKHVFTTPGKHSITLRVVDNDGMMDSITKEISVLNILPTPKFYWTKSNGSILFNASWSYDKDGSIVNYTWDFGDGSIGYGKVVQHSYAANKKYYVTLYVKDDYGETNSTMLEVNLLNNLPIVNFYWQPAHPTDLDTVYFYSTSNDSDGNITTWIWDFGDGSVAYGENVSHRYEDNGTYSVTLFVLDDENAYNITTKQIFVSNVPPVADFVYSPPFPLPNKTISFNSTSYDSDGYIVNWTWNFGDGNISYGENVSHVYVEHGIYNVSLTVIDNDGDFSTKKIKLVVADFYVNASIYDPANHTWNRIQDAINNATDGTFIYVMDGNYNEDVFVNKSVYILGKNASIIGKNYSLYLAANEIFVDNFEILDAKNGILMASNLSLIKSCKFNGSYIAINISGNYNSLEENILEGNISIAVYGNHNSIGNNEITGKAGIILYGKMNEIFSNNISAESGIKAFDSENSIYDNFIYGCKYGMRIYNENLVSNNSIYSCEYGIDGTEFKIVGNKLWNNKYAINASKIYIENCNITNNEIAIFGIEIHSNDTIIRNGSIDAEKIYFHNVSIEIGRINCTYGEIRNSRIGKQEMIRGEIYSVKTQFYENTEISVNGTFLDCNFTKNGLTSLNNSLVTNCSFYKNDRALILEDNNTVKNSSFIENEYAIFIEGNYNNIFNNTFLLNQHALYIENAKHNNFLNNNITKNVKGLEMYYSPGNYFEGNEFLSNVYAIDIYGESIEHFYNSFKNNTVNGLPLFYAVNESNFILNESYGFIGLIGCKNVSILNQEIGNNGKSILAVGSEELNIGKTKIHDSVYGIYILKSRDIEIKECNVFLNGKGILLRASTHVSISNCNISTNDIGINIFDIQNTAGNNYIDAILQGNRYGILIQGMGDNEIHGNIDSIKIDKSNENRIRANVSKLILRNGNAKILNSSIKEIDSYSSNIDLENSMVSKADIEKGSVYAMKTDFKGNMSFNDCNLQLLNSKFELSHVKIAGSLIYASNDEFYNKSYVEICSSDGNISHAKFYWNDFALKVNANITLYNCSFYENGKGAYVSRGKMIGGEIYNNSYGCILNGSAIVSNILFHHNEFALIINSSFSEIYQNSFWKNQYGVVANGSNNTIYHNNFVYNEINAKDNSNNSWNLTTPHEGNYWDDYAGSDGNNDGIGDMPYEVGKSYDFYPLMTAYENAAKVPNEAPVASFMFYPANPFSFDEISFIDTSQDPNGKNDISSWKWNFGDGNTSNEQNPKHAYARPGSYNVTLTIKDRAGAENSFTMAINITNLAPLPAFDYNPENVSSYDTIQFTSNSVDRDGFIVNYTWQFGDGSIAYGRNVSHRYTAPGVYRVILTVIDNLNSTSTCYKEIRIENRKPSADFEFYPEKPKTGEKITFKDLSSDMDGNIISWHWDFGDGTAANGRNASHAYAKPGSYKVRLTVEDNEGGVASYEQIVEVEEKETPGFGFALLMIALAIAIAAMRKFK